MTTEMPVEAAFLVASALTWITCWALLRPVNESAVCHCCDAAYRSNVPLFTPSINTWACPYAGPFAVIQSTLWPTNVNRMFAPAFVTRYVPPLALAELAPIQFVYRTPMVFSSVVALF